MQYQNGKNIPVEDLNTGPDTTENLEEVYESNLMSHRSLRDFISAHPGIQVIDTIEVGNLVKIIYKNPIHMEDKYRYEPDPQNPNQMRRVAKQGESLRRAVKEAQNADYNPETYEKIQRASKAWKEERNTDFPGAKQGEEWLKKQQEEQVRDSGDVMFGVDCETQGLQGNVDPMMSREFLERYREPIVLGPNPVITPGSDVDDMMYPTTEEMKKHIDEQCNKNVSPGDKPADYYHYGRILERMDDTHRRKNSDYGDAAYQGYKKFGDYYFLVQLHNKLSRLESLTVGNKSQQVKEESIDDTLLDMANYAVMYLESRHRND